MYLDDMAANSNVWSAAKYAADLAQWRGASAEWAADTAEQLLTGKPINGAPAIPTLTVWTAAGGYLHSYQWQDPTLRLPVPAMPENIKLSAAPTPDSPNGQNSGIRATLDASGTVVPNTPDAGQVNSVIAHIHGVYAGDPGGMLSAVQGFLSGVLGRKVVL